MRHIFTVVYSAAYFLAALSLFLLSYACSSKPQPIARVFDKYLFPDDLKDVVPAGVAVKDSLQLVQAYIEQWQHRQLLLNRAKKHIASDDAELNRRVDEYKNGLMIYEYEQSLVSEKLDTLVTDAEIRAYYDKASEIFVLKQPIFKLDYIKLKPGAPQSETVKRWLLSADIRDQDLLAEYCSHYASLYLLHDTLWHYKEEISQKVPFERINEHEYKNFNRIFEFTENNELYLIILHDSKFNDMRSPLSLERDKIRKLILNKRKTALLDQLEKEVLETALKKDNIEIFNQ